MNAAAVEQAEPAAAVEQAEPAAAVEQAEPAAAVDSRHGRMRKRLAVGTADF